MKFGFEWPLGLTARHVHQLLFGKRTGALSEILPDVCEQTGVEWSLEDCYTWLEQFEQASVETGFYVLDGSSHPEEWRPPALPRVVRSSMYFIDPAINNTPKLLKRYEGRGKSFPKGLNEEERAEALAAVRQDVIYYQPCCEEGCPNEVTITLGQAGRAIQKFGLTADNPYKPSTRCKACRAKEQTKAEGRTPVKASDEQDDKKGKKGKKKEKGLATLGEITANKE